MYSACTLTMQIWSQIFIYANLFPCRYKGALKSFICNFGIKFSIFPQIIVLKKVLPVFLVLCSLFVKGQNVENIFVNLYTDSLKKGTYNYINIDGLLADKTYTPLDSSSIIFWASDGKFYGNMLLLDKDFKKDKVAIKVTLRKNPSITKEFIMPVKRKEDDEKLKTTEEILRDIKESKTKSKKKNKARPQS
jgi:hypothetical protein